jgi:hypothetical protein
MVLNVGVTFTLMWSDPRLFRAPCAAALSSMLSVESGASAAEISATEAARAYLWIPQVNIAEAISNTLTYSSFELHQSVQWPNVAPTGGSGNCIGCATLTSKHVIKIKQPAATFKPYTYYPFDDHEGEALYPHHLPATSSYRSTTLRCSAIRISAF